MQGFRGLTSCSNFLRQIRTFFAIVKADAFPAWRLSMNFKKILLTSLVLLLSGLGNVWAGGRLDVYIGPSWGPRHYPSHRHYYPMPYYFPPPIYYPPQVIVVPPPEPQVYIEQAEVPVEPVPQAAPAQQYWYYCTSAKGYYPYVKECPGGWQKVLPVPPGK